MKFLHFAYNGLPSVILLTLALSPSASAACTATGFMRDSMNLTAAVINTTVAVGATVDATGCNIGIYYSTGTHTINTVTVVNASSFGIVNNGASVTIENSIIHDVGLNTTFDDQGYGIYFAIGSGAHGSITGNFVWNYGNSGIVVNGGLPSSNASVAITANSVVGVGPSDTISQTAIQLGFGALGNIASNTIIANSYSGLQGGQGTGILVFGGPCYILPPNSSPTISGITIADNILVSNNVGIAVFNLDASCNTSTNASNNSITGNLIQKSGVTSKTGWSVNPPEGYQAGVQDAAKGDTIELNTICGHGYAPRTPPPYLHYIDRTLAIAPIIGSNNTSRSCPAPALATDVSAASSDLSESANVISHGPIQPVIRR